MKPRLDIANDRPFAGADSDEENRLFRAYSSNESGIRESREFLRPIKRRASSKAMAPFGKQVVSVRDGARSQTLCLSVALGPGWKEVCRTHQDFGCPFGPKTA